MAEGLFTSLFEYVESREEDLIIIVLIVFSIAIFVGAFAAFNSDIAQAAQQEASAVSQRISNLSFLQRIDYLGSIFFPWILMLSTMIIAREVWLYGRKIDKEKEKYLKNYLNATK